MRATDRLPAEVTESARRFDGECLGIEPLIRCPKKGLHFLTLAAEKGIGA